MAKAAIRCCRTRTRAARRLSRCARLPAIRPDSRLSEKLGENRIYKLLFWRYRMIPQSAPTSSFLKPQSPHLHIDGATCPWCEQEIPPERLEEIRGKIAAREREQPPARTGSSTEEQSRPRD